ncbi:MAG: 30S ribosomal protein S20 [Burkholderiales bacterium]
MANTAQARKRARQSVKRNAHNTALRSTLRTAIKKVRKAVAAGNKADAETTLSAASSVIDRIADKRIVHKNSASRFKSRLSHSVKAMP